MRHRLDNGILPNRRRRNRCCLLGPGCLPRPGLLPGLTQCRQQRFHFRQRRVLLPDVGFGQTEHHVRVQPLQVRADLPARFGIERSVQLSDQTNRFRDRLSARRNVSALEMPPRVLHGCFGMLIKQTHQLYRICGNHIREVRFFPDHFDPFSSCFNASAARNTSSGGICSTTSPVCCWTTLMTIVFVPGSRANWSSRSCPYIPDWLSARTAVATCFWSMTSWFAAGVGSTGGAGIREFTEPICIEASQGCILQPEPHIGGLLRDF